MLHHRYCHCCCCCLSMAVTTTAAAAHARHLFSSRVSILSSLASLVSCFFLSFTLLPLPLSSPAAKRKASLLSRFLALVILLSCLLRLTLDACRSRFSLFSLSLSLSCMCCDAVTPHCSSSNSGVVVVASERAAAQHLHQRTHTNTRTSRHTGMYRGQESETECCSLSFYGVTTTTTAVSPCFSHGMWHAHTWRGVVAAGLHTQAHVSLSVSLYLLRPSLSFAPFACRSR